MKIAFIVGQFPALSETFILNQITGLINCGHEVDIYTDNPSNEPKIHPDIEKYNLLEHTYYSRMPANHFLRVVKGVKLLVANLYKNPLVLLRSLNVFKYGKNAVSLTLLYAAIPLLRKQPYDIIHCHFGPVGLKGALLRDIGTLQGKLITTFHGFDLTTYLQKYGERIQDLLFNKGDLFLPISNLWKRRLVELGCDEKKVMVHRMGIDCRKFAFIPRELHADGRVRLLTICRLVEKKGVKYGILAIAKLAKVNPNIEYNIVGDGPLKENLQQLIQELDIGDIVKLLGWKQQQELVDILNNTDILIAPSVTSENGDQEGIPVAIMEAMAVGLPIISTQHSSIPELVEDGVSGFLVPEKDVNALAKKLGYMIEQPQIRLEMGRAGRAYVENYYNINKLNEQLLEIYHQLLI